MWVVYAWRFSSDADDPRRRFGRVKSPQVRRPVRANKTTEKQCKKPL